MKSTNWLLGEEQEFSWYIMLKFLLINWGGWMCLNVTVAVVIRHKVYCWKRLQIIQIPLWNLVFFLHLALCLPFVFFPNEKSISKTLPITSPAIFTQDMLVSLKRHRRRASPLIYSSASHRGTLCNLVSALWLSHKFPYSSGGLPFMPSFCYMYWPVYSGQDFVFFSPSTRQLSLFYSGDRRKMGLGWHSVSSSFPQLQWD